MGFKKSQRGRAGSRELGETLRGFKWDGISWNWAGCSAFRKGFVHSSAADGFKVGWGEALVESTQRKQVSVAGRTVGTHEALL